MRKYPIDGEITAAQVMVIMPDGTALGVINRFDAMNKARDMEMNLIQIDSSKTPPTCRIADFGKFRYDLEKKEKAVAKRKHKELHEISLNPKCGSADLDVKVKKVLEFLGEGDDVKFKVQFKGREMAHVDVGVATLTRLLEKITIPYQIIQPQALTGRNIYMTIGKK